MDTKRLEEYLKILVDLEKEKYMEAATISALERKIKDYQDTVDSNSIMLALDSVSENRSSALPTNIKVDQSGKWLMYFAIYYCACMGAIILGGGVFLITKSPIAFVTGVIGAIIGGSFPWKYWQKTLANRRVQLEEQYKSKQRADKQAVINCRKRTDELEFALPKMREALSGMKTTYQDTVTTLNKCYSLNIIPKDYRKMVPVCMFYDYIRNKRTYSIERNPVTSDVGAINMYEDEMYKKLIITKLNDVISNLKQIQYNQSVLYDAVTESARETQRLIKSVDDNITDFKNNVNRKMDVMIHQNERMEAHQRYLSYVAYQDYTRR